MFSLENVYFIWGVAFIPGVGWIIGAAYFLADPIVTKYKGKQIGEHLGDASNSAVSNKSFSWNNSISGLTSLEAALSKGWHF